jgi:hypothetical protein
MPSTISQPVTARIPLADVDRLQRAAEREGSTVSACIAEFVHQGLSQRAQTPVAVPQPTSR